MRRCAVLAVVLAMALSFVVTAPSNATEEVADPASQVRQFGPGHDDPGNVSWLATNLSAFVTGGNRLYTGQDDTLLVSVDPGYQLEVEAFHDGGLSTQVTLRAPEDGEFTPGFYEARWSEDGRTLASVRVEGPSDRCTPWGSYEIKHITPEVDQLWMTWATRCVNGRAGVGGEVRFNMPGDPVLDVAPSVVDLLAAPVGGYLRPTAVTLINRSDRAVGVGEISLDGSTAWTRRWSTCGIVEAGDFCRVWVRFAPATPGEHRATLRATTTAGVVSVPLRAIGSPTQDGTADPPPASQESDAPAQPDSGSGGTPRREWLMTSEPDMWVGNGCAHHFGAQDQYGVVGGDVAVVFTAETSTSGFDGILRAPPSEALLPGTETRGPYPNERLIEVTGDSRGCGRYEGDFRVLEADYDLFGALERLLVTFRMNCAGRTANLWGTIAHRSLGPVPEPPGYPARSTVNAQYATRSPVAGASFGISGRLSSPGADRRSARPRALVVEHREGPRKRWFRLGSTRADRGGSYATRVVLTEDAQVRVRFPGARGLAPSSSAPRWIRPR